MGNWEYKGFILETAVGRVALMVVMWLPVSGPLNKKRHNVIDKADGVLSVYTNGSRHYSLIHQFTH